MKTQNLLTENPLLCIAIFLAGALTLYVIRKIFSPSSNSNENVRPSTMSPKVIQNMVDNYRNNQLKSINDALGINDAITVSFELKKLKNFLKSVESETRKVNAKIEEEQLGVRCYYAAYPIDKENLDAEFRKEEFARRHTIIMIPTLKLKNDQGVYLDYDFNPLDPSTYSRNRNSDNNVQMQTMMSTMSAGSSEVIAFNHGSLIPPATVTPLSY
ncbi:hypothetical protein [Flavobacterium sp.]|uniref:hypothetical protein n=1 Tax=Flavobacterium sp. TaxID=239 RepID=UPI002CA51CE3|nr:hypothetical protein [Flavobacterium sp.]HSD07292.1 hypothetical protein [Flavobacterium sp.]